MAMLPLDVSTELLINGTWTDISPYVLLRDDVTITGGNADAGDKPDPAQLTLTLDNRDGRFTPGYTSGAYYPYLQRNTRIRVRVAATSSNGTTYDGFRFTGEVSDWPPRQDMSGRDAFVMATASGPLRRIRKGGGKGSALTRYYNTLTGSFVPVAYWPCEADPDSSVLGAGVEGGTDMEITTGTPRFKSNNSFNGSAPMAVVSKSTWTGLTGSFGSSGNDVYTTPGDYTWVASTTTVDARCTGGGGGGQGGGTANGRPGGGGGEFAKEAALAVTPGVQYMLHVAAGGEAGLATAHAGGDGEDSTIAGDAVTVRAHGGTGGASDDVGAGGSGSANSVTHPGGPGGSENGHNGGGGGGGSGGTAATGNSGADATGSSGANGASAVTGGGAGGRGGDGGGGTSANGHGGLTPGGGGGGGGQGSNGGKGGNGAPGRVELVYTPSASAPANVIRFLIETPKWGGNPGKILLQAFTGGTIARLEVLYQSGGKLQLRGYDIGNVLKFDSGSVSASANGQPMLVSAELTNSGANVAWALKTIKPGAKSLNSSTSGTVVTASCGNVSTIIVSPNADITKTALGHISLQYAVQDVRKVSAALDGHHSEMGIDRFLRLTREEALEAEPQFAENSDHWGFETDPANFLTTNNTDFEVSTGTWTGAGNCTPTRSTTLAHAGTASLRMASVAGGTMNAASCTAGNILTQGLACAVNEEVRCTAYIRAGASVRAVSAGLDFYTSGGVFISSLRGTAVNDRTTGWTQVTCQIAAPATAARCRANIQVASTAAANEFHYVDDVYMANMSTGITAWTPVNALLNRSPDVVTGSWPSLGSWSMKMRASGAGSWSAHTATGTSGVPVTPGDRVSAAADVYTPAALGAVSIAITWYDSGGAVISTETGDVAAPLAGDVTTLAVSGKAPLTPTPAAFFAITVADNEASSAGTLMYVDEIRTHPEMGPQSRKAFHHLLQEIEDLDQGILKESRKVWGLGYRTRISLINQSVALTLDWNKRDVSPPLEPVVDDHNTKNDITVKRHKGSNVRVTLNAGAMSVNEPSGGSGRYRKTISVIARRDEQLAALADHLLGLGTAADERYPQITVNLVRGALTGLNMATIMPACAGVEIGDRIQIVNLPFWYPHATADCLVLGYTEVINTRRWTITWNCMPYVPYIRVGAFRRW